MNNEQIGLRHNVNVKVLTRIHALYMYIYEMAESFGVDEKALESIEKGVLRREIIQEINIYYKDANNTVLGKITISIDWDRHQFLASTEGGKTFIVNTDRSLHSQISNMTDEIIHHVDHLRKSLPITKIKTTFSYISEIKNDTKKTEDAMDYLDHCFVTEDDKEDIKEEFRHSIELVLRHLDEVSVRVEHI